MKKLNLSVMKILVVLAIVYLGFFLLFSCTSEKEGILPEQKTSHHAINETILRLSYDSVKMITNNASNQPKEELIRKSLEAVNNTYKIRAIELLLEQTKFELN